jgi:hypothetical protein
MAFSLLSRIPDGVKPLLEIYERYITTTGKGMIAKMSQQTLKVQPRSKRSLKPANSCHPLPGTSRVRRSAVGFASEVHGRFVVDLPEFGRLRCRCRQGEKDATATK